MTRWLDWLNATGGEGSAWLWRVTWQAAIVVAVAWLLTLALRRGSPRLRSWIWRLAYLKLLVLMVWTTPVRLAVLPAPGVGNDRPSLADPQTPAPAAPPYSRDAQQSALASAPATAPSNRELPANGEIPSNPAFPSKTDPSASAAPANSQSAQTSSALAWPAGLLLAWLGGMVLVVGWLAWEITRAVQLRRSVQIVSNQELEAALAEVGGQMRTRAKVHIGESLLAGGPMLVKLWTPLVVFPAGLIEQLSAQDLRLALAHELAHLKRHDLAWNALAAVVHVLLFFHPLVWLAHRWARQEQEMACDELVVTRLGIERHEYGQMLMKVVRRLGRKVPTGMAVVGMASSYQTLARRISAMRHIRNFTRRQIAFAGGALALLGCFALVPWQVVAQQLPVKSGDRAPTANTPQAQGLPSLGLPESNSSLSPSAPLSPAASASLAMDDTQLTKLLVGLWRDSSGKEIEFFADGTYEDLSAKIDHYKQSNGVASREVHERRNGGQFTITNGQLTLSDDSEFAWDWRFESPSHKPPQDYSGAYKITRLDDSFLRMKGSPIENALFYRKVDVQAAEKKLSAIPAELRPIFAAAGLNTDEAQLLLQLFQDQNLGTSWLKNLSRVVDAQHHKITLKQLCDLNADEVSAFKQVLSQAGDQRLQLFKLAEAGELAPVEKSAIEKIEAVDDEFNTPAICELWINDSDANRAKGSLPLLQRRAQAQFKTIFQHRNPLLPAGDQLTLVKLQVAVEDLDEWFQQAVYATRNLDFGNSK